MFEFIDFTEDISELAELIIASGECDSSDIVAENTTYTYIPTGEKTCWKCTLKHLGVAFEYASELQKYPHHFIKCIGALVAASRECPSSKGRELLYTYYNKCLDKDVIEDMNTLLSDIYSIYREQH